MSESPLNKKLMTWTLSFSSTYHWLVWGILESALSTIEWDYWEYSRDKYRLYKEIKPKYYGVESYEIFSDI